MSEIPESAKLVAFLGSAPVVYALTLAAKKLPFIPLFQGQKVRIRAVAGVLSAVGAVLFAVSDETLSVTHLQTAIVSLAALAYSWGGAELLHRLKKKIFKEEEKK